VSMRPTAESMHPIVLTIPMAKEEGKILVLCMFVYFEVIVKSFNSNIA